MLADLNQDLERRGVLLSLGLLVFDMLTYSSFSCGPDMNLGILVTRPGLGLKT